MLFSRDWLAEYVDLPEGAEDLADRLTAIGLAVEGLESRDRDLVLDVEVTTNRPDCMSHLGLARELAVALAGELRVPTVEVPPASPDALEDLRIAIDPGAAAACPRYVGLAVDGVRVGPSPDWLVRRLEAIGLRSLNNVVDATNYSLWESGQPLHAFDRDRLRGGVVTVRFAAPGERLRTLDGVDRELADGDLLITDAEGGVALAGVMGGADSEVGPQTTRLLIESAHFDPATVRGGAGRHGLHTDASHRFERGTDLEICAWAAQRAAELIVEVAGGRIAPVAVDLRGPAPPPLRGDVDAERLSGLAGFPVALDDARRIFEGLGFGIEEPVAGHLELTVPSWRYHDFAACRPDGRVWFADLAEEVVRQIGLAAVPAALPGVAGPDAPSADGHRRRGHLRAALSAAGYLETIGYAFIAAEEDAAWPGPTGGATLPLANPMSERLAVMRRSLLPGLVQAATYNLHRGAPGVRLFESGHVFAAAGEGETGEWEALAWVAAGHRGRFWDQGPEADFGRVRGLAEEILQRFGVAVQVRPAQLPGFVPGAAAELVDAAGGVVLGQTGRLLVPGVAAALFAAELLVDSLPVVPRRRPVELPGRFPAIEVDTTLTHRQGVRWEELAAVVDAAASAALQAYAPTGRYTGEGVPEGALNTTIRFTYASPERSLSQEEVNDWNAAIVTALQAAFAP